ncbi:MAG: hypothetical protein GEU93_00995 [Propionibacteriales bacterium]|nr:hypothetical protein [Propionibacteriales bacterium]
MTARCLDLSDERARDAAVAGAKAAGLAAASAAGLPTLPGVVVPVGESDPVVRAASTTLLGEGVARARLAAMTVQPDEPLLAELRERAACFPAPMIVRSSSPLEADGTWSGAFSSFHGVGPDDLGTAVRGCWGSAFQVGSLERAHHTGTDPTRLGLAVLVQPEVAPGIGGTARRRFDGSVQVTATRGPLSPLMSGQVEGTVTVVGADDTIKAVDVERDLLLEVASLSRRVHEVLDHQLIEWAEVDGKVHLLQSIRSADRPAQVAGDRELDAIAGSDVAVRVAGLTQRFPGRLGYELILPWAVADGPLRRTAHTTAGPDPGVDPVALLAATRSLSRELTAMVWRRSPRAAAAEAERMLRLLRGDAPEAALRILQGLPGPSPDAVQRVLGNLESLRRTALARGVVDSDAAFWRLGPDDLDRGLRSGAAPGESRLGVDRWEPFAHHVVMATGTHVAGTPAAPGAGVGRAYVADSAMPRPVPSGRCVLVANQPVPSLAPLLWNAAGLVTRAGSAGAHLIEFAHSIGVPTVVGCDVPDPERVGPDPVVAVDGSRGLVSVASLP